MFTVGEDGKKRYTYKHWGTLEDGDRFHPGTNYFHASVAERDRLIFPVAWDMSEVTELSSTRRRGRVSYQDEDVDRQYGATWLLDKVAEATGVKDDLLKVLGGNHEMVNDVLTLAYFPFIENLSYSQLSQWQKEVKAPSEHELNSVSITRLTQSITERHRMDLFRCRARRVGRDELCSVDSTSMSTYGFNLVDIRWGKNKERLPLRQTMEVVVYSLTSHMPIYYKELPGNMPDCGTIELIMKELEHAGFRNLVLITDRGYESMKNLETYIAKGQKVITSVKVSGGDVLGKIRAIDMSRGFPQGMTIAPKDNLYYAQYDMEYSVKGNGDNVIKADKYRLNLYYNPLKRGEKICDIQHSVSEQSAELDIIIQTKEPVADREDTARRFNLLDITFNADGTIKSYGVNQKNWTRCCLRPASSRARPSACTLTPCRRWTTTACAMSRRSALRYRKALLGTTVSGHGPREAREEGCSSTLWASSWLRTYVPYGKVMKYSARSSHRQKQSLPRCARSDAWSTLGG